jgi:hypothetical protein
VNAYKPKAIAGGKHWSTFFAVAFLALVPLALFLPVFLSGKAIYGFDLIALGLPFWTEVQRSLAAHQWPLWMPDLFGGMPGIASCNLLFLYPSDLACNLLGLSFRLQTGLDAALHVALAGIGMFLFLRRLDRSASASLLGAFFFSISGSEVSKVFGGHYNFVEGIAMVPWAFWSAHKGCKDRDPLGWGLCGLAFALQILAGAAQLFAYTLAAVAAFVLATVWPSPAARGIPGGRSGACLPVLKGLALALGLAFLLAAPQLWTTLQYVSLSTRQGWTHAGFIDGSISLSEAVTWLVPGFYGWQTPSYHGAMGDCFTSEYFGLLPWALAAAALFAFWRRDARVRWLAYLALAAFFFAQRAWTPFYPLFRVLPVVSGFRIWFRILFLLTFAVCTLASYGWDALRTLALRAAALRGVAVFTAFAFLIAALAWAMAKAKAQADAGDMPWLSHFIADPRQRALYLTDMARSSAAATLKLVPVLAGILWFSARSRGPALALALALLLAFHAFDQKQMTDRFVNMAPDIPAGKPHFVLPPPKTGLEPWRVLDDDDSVPNNDIILGYENLIGRESVPMLSFQRIKDAMAKRGMDWDDLFNVRYVFQHSRRGTLVPGDAVTIFENRGAFPRAWLVSKSRAVASDEAAYTLLADPAFDPRVEVALPQDAGLSGPPPRAWVRWLARGPQDLSLEVNVDRNAALVLSNMWYPSWRARVDAADRPVIKADGGLQAVLLTAGQHQVDLRFDPGFFDAALAASLAGILALLGLVWMGFRSKRAAQRSGNSTGSLNPLGPRL